MASKILDGGEKLRRYLTDLSARLGPGGTLKVGFLEGATYPDGSSVAMVAAINEYGRLVRSKDGDYYQLPRPHGRNMVARYNKGWPTEIGRQLKNTNGDVRLTMRRMGTIIKGQWQQSIRNGPFPPLAPSTIKRKGFSQPLIHTSHMINSVDFEYEER